MRACWPSLPPRAAPPASTCARRWPRKPTPAPPPTMRPSAAGSPASWTTAPRAGARSPAGWRKSCATARTRISRRPSTCRANAAPASPPPVQHQGKELSYNNLNDTDAAFELVAEFDPKASPAVAIIKHANPCGVAIGATFAEAYAKALRCDPTSAFGGIIALNGPIDAATAREITGIFTEVVIAPDASDEAKAIFAAKKNLRLLTTGGLPDPRAQGLTLPLAGRRLPGAVARQRRRRRSGAEGRHQAPADAGRAGRSASSPSRSPSTSSRTPSSTSRTAPRSASAPAR